MLKFFEIPYGSKFYVCQKARSLLAPDSSVKKHPKYWALTNKKQLWKSKLISMRFWIRNRVIKLEFLTSQGLYYVSYLSRSILIYPKSFVSKFRHQVAICWLGKELPWPAILWQFIQAFQGNLLQWLALILWLYLNTEFLYFSTTQFSFY